jgi:RNA polymerase sigma factor (sigma-70 family)
MTDKAMVERVLQGDTNAFANIIRSTEGLVAAIVFRMIPNGEDRKDVVQDIYLKTFQKLGTFRFQSRLSTWIGQITFNTCFSFLERRKLAPVSNGGTDSESADEKLERLFAGMENRANETEEMILKKELSEKVKNEIDKLSPVYKTLISLYHNEELGYSEIAEITSLPLGTVKNYLYRARKIVRDNLLFTYKEQWL